MTTNLVKLIAREVKKGLVAAGATESATLVLVSPGTRTPGSLASGTNPTTTSIECRGFEDNEKHDKIGETSVDQAHKVICLLGLGEIRPTSNDRVTLGGVTYPIVDADGSPACWTVLVSK